MQLRKPNIQYEKSFRDAFAEMDSESDRHPWIYLGEEAYADYFKDPFSDHVQRLIECETKAPEHFVCVTTYWAIEGDEVVGRIAIRHELNDLLSRQGGHIGYIVRPSRRGNGIATSMLKQILATDRAKNIGDLLVTCSVGNVASEKTTLKNGGQLENVVSYDANRPNG